MATVRTWAWRRPGRGGSATSIRVGAVSLHVVAMLAGLASTFITDARAAAYCAGISGGDCEVTYPGTGDGVQQALDAADLVVNLDGSPNIVRIGPGTFTRAPGLGYKVASAVIVIGQGPATVLTASPSGGGAVNDVFRSTALVSTLSNLVVRATGRAFAGVAGFTTVSDVRVTGAADVSYSVFLPRGGRGSRLLVDGTSPLSFSSGVLIKSGAVLEDAVIRVRGAANARGVVVSDDSATTQPAVIRHVTIVGESGAGSRGVQITVPIGATARTATADVRDSVVRGVATALVRSGEATTPACAPCGTGTANLSVRYSSWDSDPGARIDTGPGTFTVGPGNLDDPDPLFASVAGEDLRLLPGSPLIDAGDPALAESGDSATDAAGAPRITNARRDIGAFEAPAPAPIPPTPGGPAPNATLPVGDLSAPVLRDVRLSHTVFRVSSTSTPTAAGRMARARRQAAGTMVSYTLSENAVTTFTVERLLGGRRTTSKGSPPGRCLRAGLRRRRPNERACTLQRAAGSLTRVAFAGKNVLRFSGRIGTRRLAAGRYRVSIVAKDAAGNTGATVRRVFRIVR